MNSDTENLAPLSERGLLPIRRLSSLIPLRKASRNRNAFGDTNFGNMGEEYVEETFGPPTTFQSYQQEWPPKHLRLATGDTPTPSKRREAGAMLFATPQPIAPIRFPISPPPEDELRRSQSSSGSSRKRARSISKTRSGSPNPKAKKLPKLARDESSKKRADDTFERDFDDWVKPKEKSTKKPKAREPEPEQRDFDDWITRKARTVETIHPKTPAQKPKQRVEGVHTVSQVEKRAPTSTKTPSNKAPNKAHTVSKSASKTQSSSKVPKTPKTPSQSKRRASSKTPRSQSFSYSRPGTPGRPITPPPPIETLPPPAPPSPSDDPLLLAGNPRVYKKPKAKRSREEKESRKEEERGRKTWKEAAIDLEREVASPVANKQYSPALGLSFDEPANNEEVAADDSQYAQESFGVDTYEQAPTLDNSPTSVDAYDTTTAYEPPIPEGTDYLMPLNFGSSVSTTYSDHNSSPSVPKESSAAGSPYPRKYGDDLAGRLVTSRLEDGTPVTRKQFFTGRSPSREANLAMRMTNSPKQVDEDASTQWLPEASFGLNANDEASAGFDAWDRTQEASVLRVEDLVHKPSTQVANLLNSDDSTASASSSPVKEETETSFGGKRLSKRFAELEAKLVKEGRSFRFSEIGALPSSDGPAFATLGDLPSSSPVKSTSQSPEKLSQASVQSSPEKNSVQSSPLKESVVQEEEEDQEDEVQMIEQELSTDLPDQEEEEMPLSEGVDEEFEEPLEQDIHLEVEQSVIVEEEVSVVESREQPTNSVNVTLEEDSSVAHMVEQTSFLPTPESTEDEEPSHADISASQGESSAIDTIQDESFISPIRHDASSVVDASSVLAEDEEPQDALVELDMSAILGEPTDQEIKLEEPVVTTSPIKGDTQEEEEEELEDEVDDDEALEGPSWEDETDVEPLVQIRSNDPDAAARAAAILNLHHEYVQGTPKRRESSVANSSRRSRSRSSSVAPSMSARSRYSQLLATPSRRDMSAVVETPRQSSLPPIPSQEWAKHQWRCLEQCFTDVRLETARSMGVWDLDPEEVDVDEVVDRFVDLFAEGRQLEGDWDWDKIRRRAMALVSRQREGTARGLRSPTPSSVTPLGPAVRIIPATSTPMSSSVQSTQYTPVQPKRFTPAPASSTAFSTPRTGYTARTYTTNDMPPPPTIPVRRQQVQSNKSIYPPLPPKGYQIPSATPLGPTVKPVPEPASATKRVWNWMGSFLRAGSETASESSQAQRDFIPILPAITDADRDALRHVSPPAPKPRARIVPPKEQVQLQHVPTPVPVREKKLNHKTSSGSVKDMIRSFESLSDTLDSSRDRPIISKKPSTGSLSGRSFDMWKEVSRDLSRSQTISQDISISSVGSSKSAERGAFNRPGWRL